MPGKIPFLKRLAPETIEEIERRGIKREWPRHMTVFRSGDRCTGLHVVVDGLVKIYRATPDGRQQIVLLEGAGGVLALAPVLDEGVQLASADTLKPTTTLFLTRDDFLLLHGAYSDFRAAVGIEMARRFRSTVALLETIALKPVPARVATRVLEIAAVNDALDGSRSFNLVLSQDELAHALGTSRESIARSLADLRAAGVIEQKRSLIRVLDPVALIDWSQFGGTDATVAVPAIL
jgi:CRP/FNR family transcriptional regulator